MKILLGLILLIICVGCGGDTEDISVEETGAVLLSVDPPPHTYLYEVKVVTLTFDKKPRKLKVNHGAPVITDNIVRIHGPFLPATAFFIEWRGGTHTLNYLI